MAYTRDMRSLILITGERNSGKTTLLRQLLRDLRQEGGAVPGGFITCLSGAGESKNRYFLEDLAGGEIRPAAADVPSGGEGWFSGTGRFWFCRPTYLWALETYRRQLDFPVLFMDEAGALELKGEGFAPSLELLAREYEGTLYLAVRRMFVEPVLEKYGLESRCGEIRIRESGVVGGLPGADLGPEGAAGH